MAQPTKPNQLRIIGLAPNKWHYVWMNRQQILSRLGKNHNVIYSQGPRFFWDRHTDAFRKAPLFARNEMSDNVCLDIPGKLPFRWPRIEFVDKSTIFLTARRWLKLLGPADDSPLVAYVFHPRFLPFLSALSPDIIVYHAYDLFRLTPGWSDELNNYEQELLKRADLIFGVSDAIVKELGTRSEREIIFMPNGVDFDAFIKHHSVPDDIGHISSPRLGYTGRITDKIDFELILKLAIEKKHWNFVFVGPVEKLNDRQQGCFDKCRSNSNVYFLGSRDRERIPAYLQAFDVGLMPYRTEGLWTEAIYPLKLHEYLAVSLPIVSSNIKTMRAYPDLVDLATSPEEWMEKISEALSGSSNKGELRVNTARAHSWDAIAGRINEEIAGLIDTS